MSTRFRDDPRYAYLSSTPIPRFYGRAQKTPPSFRPREALLIFVDGLFRTLERDEYTVVVVAA